MDDKPQRDENGRFVKGHSGTGSNSGQFKKGNTPWIKGKKGITPWNKGLKYGKGEHKPKTEPRICKSCGKTFDALVSELKRGNAKLCSVSCRYKNNRVENPSLNYAAIHKWIGRRLGKASKCEHCGIEGKKKYEWSNKSGNYTADLNDWQQLCVSCHRKYDGHSFKAWATRRNKVEG